MEIYSEGLGGTRKCKVGSQGGTNKFRYELPKFLGVLPIFIVLLGKPLRMERVANEKVQTVLARARALLAIFEVKEAETTLSEF